VLTGKLRTEEMKRKWITMKGKVGCKGTWMVKGVESEKEEC
jgi:hypothetical protein